MLIEIAYAGICHSDIHTVRGEWGPIGLPADGRPRDRRHRRRGRGGRRRSTRSATGSVSAASSTPAASATTAAPARSSTACRATPAPTAASTATARSPRAATPPMSWSTRTSCSASPTSLDFDTAAPLLCAGITTYSPLRHWQAGPGTRVAVVGMGGLGHMAVKIAARHGRRGDRAVADAVEAATTASASAPTHYYATSDPDTFSQLANSFDLIINTVSRRHRPRRLPAAARSTAPWSTSVLRPSRCRSRCSPCSATGAPSPDPRIGGIAETQEMLDFCAEHGIAAEVELIDADRHQRRLGASAAPPTSGTASSSTPPAFGPQRAMTTEASDVQEADHVDRNGQ